MKHKLFLRRYFALLLLLATSTFSWAYDFMVDGIYYDVNEDGSSVTVSYKSTSDRGYSGAVTIPSSVTYEGASYSVTSIGTYAFHSCSSLTSITIPEGVTSIGDYAFQFCSGLTSVTIPNSVTSIGHFAFEGCSGLTSVTIPETVTNMGNYAFSGCDLLPVIDNIRYAGTYLLSVVNKTQNTYTIKEGTKFIGSSAFYGCSKLTSIDIPNSVMGMGSYAFEDCSRLTSITIPESVTSIATSVFDGCTSLPVIDNLRYADTYLIEAVNKTKSTYNVKEGTRFIGEDAFRSCTNLTSVIIPNSVTNIGEDAFRGCTNLTSVIIPNSVTTIGEDAFRGCTNLTSISVASGNTKYDSRNNCNAIIETSSNTLVYGCKNTIIPNSVTSIGNSAFYDCSGLTSINIPNSVTTIGDDAFSGCYLESVTIPNSVTSIGESAFSGCSGLTSITIPNSVTSIGGRAFYGCSSLTAVYVYISEPVAITRYTFPDITNATLYVPKGCKAAYQAASYWSEFKEIIEQIPILSFADANVKAICVSNWDTNNDGELDENEAAAVTRLGGVFDGVFQGNTAITSFDELQYFTGLTTIGEYAFRGCSGLTSINIPEGVTSIGESAFSGCSSLTSITIPNSVTSIGNFAFRSCSSLTSITIPNSVTSIGNGAFSDCTGLTSITIPNSVTSIGSSAFYGCSGLTSITIPNSVTSIGRDTFSGCSGLTSINIPNSVTEIGQASFSGCSGLTSITIPNKVTRINEDTFSSCSGLTTITIPNSITRIDREAFRDCSGLISVISEIEEPFVFGNKAFSGISSKCVLTVPAGKKDAYIAKGWTTSVFQGGVKENASSYNRLRLSDVSGVVGARCVLPISMSNTESIKGLQFDLRLPDGVTVATDEYDEMLFTLTSRAHSSHAVSASRLNNGDYRVVVSSLSAKTFNDTEGVIMNVTLNVDKNLAAGDYGVKLFSIVLNTVDNVSIMPRDATSTLTLSDIAIGDANGDGNINVTDVGMVIDHILEHTPNGFIAAVADVNGDGDINVTDVGLIIDIILSDNSAREAMIEDFEDFLEPQ